MTIELKPEQERIIEYMIKSGQVHDVDQFLAEAFAAWLAREHITQSATPPSKPPAKNMVELFEPVRGLFDDGELDFSRNPSTGRPLDL
jgi:hypothetical protein